MIHHGIDVDLWVLLSCLGGRNFTSVLVCRSLMSLDDHSHALVHHVLQLHVEDRIDDALATGQLALLPLGKAVQLLDQVLQL